jgi:hypothetical protein
MLGSERPTLVEKAELPERDAYGTLDSERGRVVGRKSLRWNSGVISMMVSGLPWRLSDAGPGACRTVVMGPASETLHMACHTATS